MPTNLSLMPTHAQFLTIYKRLRANEALFNRTPIVFCEGDSWFSTPLAMNILDWLVFPTPQEEELGVPVFGRGGLFYRDETSGDVALEMFTPKNIARLMKAYKAFEFDIALVSGGGNDFVDTFLKTTLGGQKTPITVDEAFARVVATGQYDAVRTAYAGLLDAMVSERPKVPIVLHTYCYPIKIGTPGALTLENIGAAALLKHKVGAWIGPHIAKALPAPADQQAFARMLIDGFKERVLDPLAATPKFRKSVRVLDLRTLCPSNDDWFDEMHPTGAAFHRLSKSFQGEISSLFVVQ